MGCPLAWTVVIGIVSGVLTGVASAYLYDCLKERRIRGRFDGMNGTYTHFKQSLDGAKSWQILVGPALKSRLTYVRAGHFKSQGWAESEGEDGAHAWSGYIQMVGESDGVGTGEFRYPTHLSWDGSHHLTRLNDGEVLMKVIQYSAKDDRIQTRFVEWRKDSPGCETCAHDGAELSPRREGFAPSTDPRFSDAQTSELPSSTNSPMSGGAQAANPQAPDSAAPQCTNDALVSLLNDRYRHLTDLRRVTAERYVTFMGGFSAFSAIALQWLSNNKQDITLFVPPRDVLIAILALTSTMGIMQIIYDSICRKISSYTASCLCGIIDAHSLVKTRGKNHGVARGYRYSNHIISEELFYVSTLFATVAFIGTVLSLLIIGGDNRTNMMGWKDILCLFAYTLMALYLFWKFTYEFYWALSWGGPCSDSTDRIGGVSSWHASLGALWFRVHAKCRRLAN